MLHEQSRHPDVGDSVRTTMLLSTEYNMETGIVVNVLTNAGRRSETLYEVEFEFGKLTLTAEQLTVDNAGLGS